jgi:hypothetical protein
VVLTREETLLDVTNRDVVMRVVRPLPHVPRPRGVEDQLATQPRPNTPWRGFGVIGFRDHLRIIAISCRG